MYKLRVFRNINGTRVPYDIELDKHRNVVREEVNDVELQLQMRHPDSYVLGPPAVAPGEVSQFLPSVPTLRRPNTVVKAAHADTADFLKKYVEWSARIEPPLPNPFPGTDALRSEFFAAMDAEIAAAEAEGRECTDCELSSISRQYKMKLKALLDS